MKKEKSKAWLELRENAPGMARLGLSKVGNFLKEQFILTPKQALTALRGGLIRRAPMLALTLALCAVMPATASIKAALGTGLAAAAVLVLTQFAVAFLPAGVPRKVRVAVYCVLAAGLAAAAGIFLHARFPIAAVGVGGALFFAAANCLLLVRSEAFGETQTSSCAALDGLSAGLGLTLALAALGTVRELLGAGTLWGQPILHRPALMLAAPCGGLLLLGVCVAGARWLRVKLKKGGRQT